LIELFRSFRSAAAAQVGIERKRKKQKQTEQKKPKITASGDWRGEERNETAGANNQKQQRHIIYTHTPLPHTLFSISSPCQEPISLAKENTKYVQFDESSAGKSDEEDLLIMGE